MALAKGRATGYSDFYKGASTAFKPKSEPPGRSALPQGSNFNNSTRGRNGSYGPVNKSPDDIDSAEERKNAIKRRLQRRMKRK